MKMISGGITGALNELQEDSTVPKNLKMRVQEVVDILREGNGNPMHKSKALDIMEEILEDVNLQPDIRTKIWNIISLLESV